MSISSSVFLVKIFDRVNVRTLEAIVRTHGKIHVLDRHGKDLLLFVVFVFHEDIHPLDEIGKIYEQADVILHDFGRQRDDFLCGKGAVGLTLP